MKTKTIYTYESGRAFFLMACRRVPRLNGKIDAHTIVAVDKDNDYSWTVTIQGSNGWSNIWHTCSCEEEALDALLYEPEET